MIRLNRFAFSTIALISGAPKHDRYVAQIVNMLKTVSTEEHNYVGVIGSGQQSSLSKVYASSSHLDNNPFEVYRAYNSYHEDIQDSVVPYRIKTHYKNYQLIKELETQNFFEDVFNKNYNAVVTVGNFSLSLRISEKLNAYCKAHKKVRPYTALFDQQRSERTVENEEFLDFQYYNIEKPITNMSGYTFPSLCVGYEGLYNAFRHLQLFKQDPNNDSFASYNFSYDVSQLVQKSRAQFRKEKDISEDKYIFYIDAGNNANEVKFSYKAFKDGFNKFFEDSSISHINKDHFQIFLNLPSNKLAEQIKAKMGFLPSNIKVTTIEQKDKYSAICASDFGLLHNGEATVEAAALQLPSLVVDSRSNLYAYWNNMFNGHASPLNIATNYQAYNDLVGSMTTTPYKIGQLITQHFNNPKLRYYYAKLYRNQIQSILSKSGTCPSLSVTETGLEAGCKHLLLKAAASEEVTKGTFRKERERKAAFQL